MARRAQRWSEVASQLVSGILPAPMNYSAMFKCVSALPIVALALLLACRQQEPTAAQKKAIAAAIEQEVRTAYDLKSPDVEKNFEHLYPDTGRIISASGGRIVMSRDTLFAGIHA